MILKTFISVQLFLTAWAATVPSPTVPGVFNFTSLMDMVVNISGPTASSSNVSDVIPNRTCRLREIAECFSATAPRFYTAVINIYRRDTRMSICGIADDFNTCARPYRARCTSSETLSFDIFTGLIQYLCTEQGYNDYLSLVPCVSNRDVSAQIDKCVDSFPSPLLWDDLCRLPDNYTSCVINATRGYCDGMSADMLRQTLMTILYPLKIATCQNIPSPTGNKERAVTGKEFPTDSTTTTEAQPTASAEPVSGLEIRDSSLGESTLDVTSTLVYPADLSTSVPDFITTKDLSSSLSTVLPAVQSYLMEISTVLPDKMMMTHDVSILDSTFATPQVAFDGATASLTDFPASQTVSQDLTATAELISSLMYQGEYLSTSYPILQDGSVTVEPQILLQESAIVASQILQKESLTTASPILQDGSVVVTPQILQENFVTTAPQILQEESVTVEAKTLIEESVTTASQILGMESVTTTSKILPEEIVTTATRSQSEESSTISPDVTTSLIYELSIAEANTQTPVEDFSKVVPGISKSFADDSSNVVSILDASSVEIINTSSYITPHLSLGDMTLQPLDSSRFIQSTESISTDASEVPIEESLVQSTAVVKTPETSGEAVLLTRSVDQERADVLTTVTEASSTTSPLENVLTIALEESVTATPSSEFLIDATTAVSGEFSTVSADVADLPTSSRELSTATTGSVDRTSVVPGDLPTTPSLGDFPTTLEDTRIRDSLKEFSTASREVRESLVLEVVPSLEYVETPVEATPVVTSSSEFSTVYLRDTAQQTLSREMSTVPFEVTTVQGSEGEFSTAALVVTPSELSSANLMTELPLVNTSQKVSDTVSSLPIQTSTAQTLSEAPLTAVVAIYISSLTPEGETVSVTVPQATELLSSLGVFSTVVPDNVAFEPSTELLSASVLDTFAPEISEQFPTVALNIETSQITTEEVLTHTTDVTITESPVSRFVTVATDIGAPGDSSRAFVILAAAATLTPVPSEQFFTFTPEILTSKVSAGEMSSAIVTYSTGDFVTVTATPVLSEQFSTLTSDTLISKVSPEEVSSMVVADISVQELSSVAPDITMIHSAPFPTSSQDMTIVGASATASLSMPTSPDITTVGASATAALSITTLDASSPVSEISSVGTSPNIEITEILDISSSASEINTNANIDTTETSTISPEISASLPVTVPTITLEYTPSAQETSAFVIDLATVHPSLEHLQTSVIQESSTEYTTIVEGTSVAVSDLTISPISSVLSSVTTQQFQISPTSVVNLSTATADVTTAQTASQETTTTASDTTTASSTTTSASTTSVDFRTSPLNCYECHSGAPGSWQNVNCPADGRIQNWAATPRLCHGPCVSIVSRYPAGNVYRACSTNYYFPTATPRDGCTRQDQGLFCFCSTHFCNNQDMVQKQQEYIRGTNF